MTAFLGVYVENWSNWWPQLVPAIANTLMLTVLAFALAVGIGIVLALGKLSRLRVLRGACIAYVEITRGIPSLAILFLIFDVEAVFLFPWAVTFLSVGKAAFYEMVVFIAVLGAGLAYAWKKGVLRWR